MFVQVIQGPVRNADEALEMFDRWMDEVRPSAIGWLGTTAGVTDDGQFIAIVRFTSEEEARRNSGLPAQDAWWAEMEKRFTGAVSFHDCRDVGLVQGGGRDDAGFVQVIQSRIGERVGAVELADEAGEATGRLRPDVIGGIVAMSDDVATVTMYFTSEEEARRGEAQDLPEGETVGMARWEAAMPEPTYFDLRHPVLASA